VLLLLFNTVLVVASTACMVHQWCTSHLDNRAGISCSISIHASKISNDFQLRNTAPNGCIPD
jgi:hypothetical protein